mmetsp:Transcript_69509/g.157126  ORF Transcript_69509/g.157126 Transcript_69509/m.157126 type:complete len:350 (+) Transcript_69509:265-1314(+)
MYSRWSFSFLFSGVFFFSPLGRPHLQHCDTTSFRSHLKKRSFLFSAVAPITAPAKSAHLHFFLFLSLSLSLFFCLLPYLCASLAGAALHQESSGGRRSLARWRKPFHGQISRGKRLRRSMRLSADLVASDAAHVVGEGLSLDDLAEVPLEAHLHFSHFQGQVRRRPRLRGDQVSQVEELVQKLVGQPHRVALLGEAHLVHRSGARHHRPAAHDAAGGGLVGRLWGNLGEGAGEGLLGGRGQGGEGCGAVDERHRRVAGFVQETLAEVEPQQGARVPSRGNRAAAGAAACRVALVGSGGEPLGVAALGARCCREAAREPEGQGRPRVLLEGRRRRPLPELVVPRPAVVPL